MKQICILGLGYIGLPTALMLASSGYSIVGVDTNTALLERLKRGCMETEEPGLQQLMQQALIREAIEFSPRPVESDTFIIAVPTPLNHERKADISFVIQALDSIIPCLKPQNLIIVESTIPPGCCKQVLKPRLESAGFTIGQDIFLAHCPERVLPGRILEELLNCPRIIGGVTPGCSEQALQIYHSFSRGELFITDSSTAEMTKLVENTYRDVNIALVNELTLICWQLGINVLQVIEFANQHPRVSLLNPGPGVGGHCIAVDPCFIVEKAPEQSRLIKLSREINSSMPEFIVKISERLVDYDLNAKMAIFGLAFKGNVSDIRESPAIAVKDALMARGFSVSVYDPHISDFENSLNETVQNADLILILTDHDDFKNLDYSQLALQMKKPIIFDTRNILSPEDNNTMGCRIYNLGNIAEIE